MNKLNDKACVVIVALDRLENLLVDCVREITARSGRAIVEIADVSRPEDVRRSIKHAVRKFGRLDVLVNNAGIEGAQAFTADCKVDNWDHVIVINPMGVFLGIKYGIAAMLKTGGDSIVNIASVAGLVGFVNIPVNCASNGGVLQYTLTVALEYAAQNIRVNAICPSVIWMPIVERFIGRDPAKRATFESLEPVRRSGTPEEVAQMALFLPAPTRLFAPLRPSSLMAAWCPSSTHRSDRHE